MLITTLQLKEIKLFDFVNYTSPIERLTTHWLNLFILLQLTELMLFGVKTTLQNARIFIIWRSYLEKEL